MDDFSLKVDSFNLNSYTRKINGVYIHESIDLSDTIYHYLKLENLLNILITNSFRFSNRKSFTDQSEQGKKSYTKNAFRMSPCFSDKNEEENYKELVKQRDKQISDAYKTCVSCWTYDMHHLLDSSQLVTEDFFMWKVYAGNGIGVRIETTIEDLINSFQNLPCDILMSKVNYKEEEPTYSVDEAVFTKPIYYDKEQELRLCALSSKEELFIKVDTKKLIHNILLSPFISRESAKGIISLMVNTFPLLKTKLKKSNILEYK